MACSRCNNTVCSCPPGISDRYGLIGSSIAKYRLQSPIPEEVRDVAKVQSWFKKNKYIPYAGNVQDSSHSYLRWLVNLTRFSPTLGSCINGIKYFAFSGKPKIVQSQDSEFDFGPTLSDQEVQLDAVSPLIEKLSLIDRSNMTWNKLAGNLYSSYKQTGNAYLVVRIKKVLDATRIYFTFVDPENCLYRVPDLFSGDKIDVSPSWDSKYIKDNPPETFSVYPYFDESATEVKTIIHQKNGPGRYGRPDWFSAAHDAFLECKNKEYLLRAVHNNFTGQVMIEVEAEQARPFIDDKAAKEQGWRNTADQWAGNFTGGGGSRGMEDQMSVLIMERPAGATPAYVHEFAVKTQEDYFVKIGEHAERNIIKANQWSKTLLGAEYQTGWSADSYVAELKTKIPIIEHYQNLIDNEMINTALDFIGQVTGDMDYVKYNVKHKGPFETILQNLQQNGQNTNNAAGGTGIQPGGQNVSA